MAGIYIHIPFCKQACYYCDFHFSTSLKHKDDLLNAIISEIDIRKNDWKNHIFKTIYFGGGTPSILPVDDIKKLLDYLYKSFNIQATEITLEANPDDLSYTKTKAYNNLGINRLSIGVQSFFDEDLVKLNRSHNAIQAENVIKFSQDSGIENITIDLIYAIPGLTNSRFIDNIDKVIDFKIPHVSAYALTVEKNTVLEHKIKKQLFPKISEDQSAEQFDILKNKLIQSGFLHYEVSNFGKKDFLSIHNSNYWKNIPYLGLGPSAHSYSNAIRSWNVSNNAIYIKKIMSNSDFYTTELLNNKDIYNELIMIGLRTMWGVDLEIISELGGTFSKYIEEKSKKYIDLNQLYIKANHLIANPDYLFVIEGIISDLFYV